MNNGEILDWFVSAVPSRMETPDPERLPLVGSDCPLLHSCASLSRGTNIVRRENPYGCHIRKRAHYAKQQKTEIHINATWYMYKLWHIVSNQYCTLINGVEKAWHMV